MNNHLRSAACARRSLLLGLCLISITANAKQLRGGPAIIWDGEAGDGLFFNATNWDPDGVPGLNDEALITMGGPVTAANMPIEVERLTVQSGLNLESSSIQVQFLSSVNNLITTGCCATGIDSGIEKLIIKGDSFLFKRAVFLGANTELQDTTTFFDGTTVRPGSSLSIKGQTTFASNVHSMESTGAVDIDGTLDLQTATLFSSGNPDAEWVFNGGTLKASGSGTSNVNDPMAMTNGTITADAVQLDINQRYEISDSQAQVMNNGTIRFLNGTLIGTNPLGISSFDGEGRIVIDGAGIDLNPSSGLTVASVTGTGLEIKGDITLNTELSNTETLRLNACSLISKSGSGRLTCDQGNLIVQTNSSCYTDVIIRSGATMQIDAPLYQYGELRIDPGALVLLDSIIDQADLFFEPSAVNVNGLLRVPNTSIGGTTIDRVPVNLSGTGQINIQDRTLSLKSGGSFSAGSILLEDTASQNYPQLVFGGDQYLFNFRNGVNISNTGTRAEVYFGNGFNPQPGMKIDGELVLNITGDQSFARIRVPLVEAEPGSRIRNLGKLILDRTATHNEIIENSGELIMSATTRMRGPQLRNELGATVTQSSLLETASVVSVQNSGLWQVFNSSQIQFEQGTDPTTTFFLNYGQMLATSGTNTISIHFINEGEVIADGAEIIFTDTTTVDQDGRRVLMGKWKTINNGKITVSQDPPTVLTGSETVVDGEGSELNFVGELEFIENGAKARLGPTVLSEPLVISSGSLEVKQGATVDVEGVLTALLDSEIKVEPGATLNADEAINVGTDEPKTPSVLDDLSGSIALALGDIPPPSIIAPAINIYANLTPIRDDTGVMNTTGALTIHPTGTLRINAEADAVSSVINHTGDLDIQGSIAITPINGYQPQLGDSFTIATVSGTIANLPNEAIGDAGNGRVFGVSAVGNEIVVTVMSDCPADLNNDGSINFFDVSAFLVAYNAMNPTADFNNDGLYNFFDVSAFLVAYNAGCP